MAGAITAAVIGGTAIVGGAYMASQAAKSAANTQAEAAGRATAAQQQALQEQQALNKPFYDVGVGAVNKLAGRGEYTPTAFNFQADPGYAFTLDQGLKAMNATAAARGGLISGNALTAGQKYGQGIGSTYYQQAFNNYLAGNAQNLQAYNANTANQQYLANLGQSSANNQANALGNFGAASAANTIGAGNAQAAGQIGQANAYTNAITQGIGAYQTNRLYDMIGNQNRSTYGSNSSLASEPYAGYNAEIGLK
jgi:hypothetical protein